METVPTQEVARRGPRVDLTGRRFGMWTVLEFVPGNPQRKARWLCRCDCGNERLVAGQHLLKGRSSGCTPRHAESLVGRKFGYWTVISRAPNKETKRQSFVMWRVRCECGTETVVQAGNLRGGVTTSCGCRFMKPVGAAALRELLQSYRWSAERRGHAFDLSDEQVRDLVSRNCHYCDAPPSRVMTHANRLKTTILFNGIDRVDNDRGYTPDNVVSCCETCNRAKRMMSASEFLAWIERVFRHSCRKAERKPRGSALQLGLLPTALSVDSSAA